MSRTDMRTTRVPMVGRRFGKLEVLTDMGPAPMGRHPKWRCRCDCGNLVVLSGAALRHDGKTDCGCEPRKRRAPAERQVVVSPVAAVDAALWAMVQPQRAGVAA